MRLSILVPTLHARKSMDGAGTVYTFCRHAMPKPCFVARIK